MCEMTKCGPADEFDFMLVMDGLTEHYEVEKVNFSSVHLSLAGTTTSARQQVIELDNTFHHFNETFHAILMKSETWKKTRLKFVYFRSIRVGANLAVSYNGFLHKLLTISIDLVPCLPLAPDVHPPEICWPIPFYYSECRCYAMLGKNADSQSWPKMHRISNTDYEEVLMRSVPQAARNAYVVTKATWSQADSKSQHIPTSYQMKTALLDSCARLLRNKEDVDSVSIAEWVRMIYEHTYEKHAIPLLQALVRSKEKEDERLRELRRRPDYPDQRERAAEMSEVVVSWNDLLILTSKTVDECKKASEDEITFHCQSFDYHSATSKIHALCQRLHQRPERPSSSINHYD
ncbi:hypothetical protein CAPTEDRAFT_191401 [Capitella teleta]|uniref:Uncharacterized protein n=1 Tax=Capitella teleta TaxID=283909 RepID=R7T6L7_CAPTE|nr:hypothetical protein CAPTEDRAFT_191401 [Capitella teleta]|eukprot:ELT87005.1 hypothetical protein CAPTEDRAFT_191401 [Capitella teleta]